MNSLISEMFNTLPACAQCPLFLSHLSKPVGNIYIQNENTEKNGLNLDQYAFLTTKSDILLIFPLVSVVNITYYASFYLQIELN